MVAFEKVCLSIKKVASHTCREPFEPRFLGLFGSQWVQANSILPGTVAIMVFLAMCLERGGGGVCADLSRSGVAVQRCGGAQWGLGIASGTRKFWLPGAGKQSRPRVKARTGRCQGLGMKFWLPGAGKQSRPRVKARTGRCQGLGMKFWLPGAGKQSRPRVKAETGRCQGLGMKFWLPRACKQQAQSEGRDKAMSGRGHEKFGHQIRDTSVPRALSCTATVSGLGPPD
jgi:hypothetical protein